MALNSSEMRHLSIENLNSIWNDHGGAASRGPGHCESRSPVRGESNPRRTKKNLEYWFWAKWTPPTKISYTSPHYYQKYEICPKTNLCEQFKWTWPRYDSLNSYLVSCLKRAQPKFLQRSSISKRNGTTLKIILTANPKTARIVLNSKEVKTDITCFSLS